jgi:hypothetical protein
MNNYLEEVGGFPAPPPVIPQILPAGPVHRWSFDGNANDSVGTQHGTLMNGATISGGRVILDGTDDFVNLNGNDIAAIGAVNGAITLEGWATTEASTGAWARLIDLGDTNPGALGRNYLFISPTAAGAVTRGSISDADPGFNHEEFTDGPIQNNGLTKHYAMVFDDANNEMTLYIDGTLVSSNLMTIPLSAISPNLGYLAKSLYPDAYLRGNIDEMRIYNYALNANHVLGNYENGPDFINAVPEPSSYAMAAFGIAGLIGVVRRRRK